MSPLMLALLTLAVPDGQEWFYPGTGDRVAVIERGATGLVIGGLPVERTGYLLARVADPEVLRALPDVAAVEVLRGDGHVVRARPRDGLDEIALSRRLHGRPGVTWVHPEFAVQLVPADFPNDPFVHDQWHLANTGQRGWAPGVDINAERAWKYSTGTGGVVAVIDTGVQSTQPDLKVQLGYDYVSRDQDSNPDLVTPKIKDGAPHGTAVAGVAAAIGNNGVGVSGVAWGSSVYGIRMIGGGVRQGDFYSAFVEAVDAGAWVLNNSWGHGDNCPTVMDWGEYHDAMEYAETMGRGGLGAAVVFAAGNGNCDISNDAMLAQPEVIAVAATNGDDKREGYSSFGAWVDLAAPSGTILTTDLVGKDGYGNWKGDEDCAPSFSGTSAATPVVSGTLLLMFAANTRLTAAQARQVLCETAARIDLENGKYDETGWSPYYGCGRVDAGGAVTAVANVAPSVPVVTWPLAQAWVERVLLQWQPATDADGDWLDYRVTWRVEGQEMEHVVDVPGGVNHLDVTRGVSLGQRVVFSVQAVDLWGTGPAGAPVTFAVVAHPVPEPMMSSGGCSVCSDCDRSGAAGPVGPALAALILLLLYWRWRGLP